MMRKIIKREQLEVHHFHSENQQQFLLVHVPGKGSFLEHPFLMAILSIFSSQEMHLDLQYKKRNLKNRLKHQTSR